MEETKKQDILQKKKDFLMEQFFLASWSAAVRRNHFWDSTISNEQKSVFVLSIYTKVKEMINSYKNLQSISSESHQNNLNILKKMKPEIGSELGIGRSQKILNLMCKYCWCMDWIPEPPHPVIDRQIISILSDENLKKNCWTKMNDEDYENLIAAFNNSIEGENSKSKWELKNWKSSLEEVKSINK